MWTNFFLGPDFVFLFLWLISVISTTDATIQKKMFGSGTTLMIYDEEMNGIMKVVKSVEDSDLLL